MNKQLRTLSGGFTLLLPWRHSPRSKNPRPKKSEFYAFLLTLCTLGMFFFANSASAQNSTVTGKVVDQADGTPIVGASVTAIGTTIGTTTGSTGSFTLSVPSGSRIGITFIGYTPVSLLASANLTRIAMTASGQALNEVVVVGYGTTRKRDLTGSVASIKSKEFNQGVITTPDQLLQGKVAGLEITTNSAAPGSASTIVIRGNSSLRAGDAPLYVVDGVPLDGRTATPGLNFGAAGAGPSADINPLLYINPNDIAQIDILRDASSTAIYGSRGANGVIVITTKRAVGDSKVHLDFGAYFSSNVGYMKKYKVFDAAGFKNALHQYALDTLKTSLNNGGSSDALKDITQKTLSQNYNLALTGGNDDGKYRASFLASNTEGFIRNTSLKKYIGTFSGQYKFLDKKLSIDFSLIAGHVTNNYAFIGNTSGAGGNLLSYTLQWNPTTNIRKPNGSFNLLSNSIPNPVGVTEGYHDRSDEDHFLGNISAEYKILPNLRYKFLYSINHGNGLRNTSFDGWLPIQGIQGLGAAIIQNTLLTSQLYTNTLDYSGKIAKNFNFNAVVGYEYYKTDYSGNEVDGTGFKTNLDQNNRIPILYTSVFQGAGTQSLLNTFIDPKVEIQSYFGRFNFNYRERYFLTATVRDDGSNKFGANNKYGVFPSVGVKWLVSNEDFLNGSNLFSNLGIRASYGITGSQAFPAGASQEQFTSNSFSNIGQSNVANPNLKWEKTKQSNIGADFAFLRGRLYGSLDYYHKNTTNLLFSSTAIQPAPASIAWINIPAQLINQGAELTLGGAIVQSTKFGWDLGINASYNKNKLTKFTQALIPTGQINGQGVSGALSQAFANNQPVDVWYLKKFSGFDAKGQQVVGGSPVFSGDPNPHVLAGFSTTIRYGKLSLNMNGSGQFGYKIYNNTYNTVTNISNLQNGKNIGVSSTKTAESLNDGVAASTRFLESGNYFKLRNATLNYSFGDIGRVLKNLNFYVSGTNLFVLTKFTGFDPEVNVDKNNNGYPSRNIEYLPYPTPRTLSFGFNAGF